MIPELMSFQPWHWLIFGLLLMVAEIFVPSFTIFWFGLAALMVSLLQWLVPSLSLTLLVLIWLVLSVAIMLLWFRVFRPRRPHQDLNLSRDHTIGQQGTVIRLIAEHNEAVVRFAMPLMGSDEWHCRCTQPVTIGQRVKVTDILGNQLIVTAI